jgi:ABC-type Mn2+/Zn2+ transport system permease subunit
MMVAASVIGICAGVVGLYLSYYEGVAAGAAIAGTIVVAYLLAIAAAGLRSVTQRAAVPVGAT